MIEDALASLREIFSKPFRAVLFKSLGLSLAPLAVLWLILERLMERAWRAAVGGPGWIKTLIEITAGLGLFVGMIFLIAPVSMLVARVFPRRIGGSCRSRHLSAGVRGTPAPVMMSLALALKFSLVALAVNLVAFCLWLLPGVNAVAFLVANAYLFGREYFQMAALRFRPLGEVQALRRRHGLTLFAAGLLVALFVAVPVLNLLTPLFGIALMARLHKRLASPVKTLN